MRTGRPPETGKKRDQALCVRFTEDEIAKIDRDRGARSRSQHIRSRSLGEDRR